MKERITEGSGIFFNLDMIVSYLFAFQMFGVWLYLILGMNTGDCKLGSYISNQAL